MEVVDPGRAFAGMMPQRARVERLLPLSVGRRVVHDAAAGLRVEHPVPDYGRPQRDRGVHVVVEREVADRARVHAAARRLEFVDDLHRPHLRRARHRSGDDVHHVRVALDDHPLGDAHRSGRRHPADVVAAEIHEHHVLGDLLRIGQEFGRERLVGLAVAPARARAGDRPQRHVAPFLAHQDLGRGAHHLEVAELVVEHVRRRVDRAQRPVERDRRCRERTRHALRDHDLHDVAGRDVLLRARHRGLERRLAELARGFGPGHRGLVGNGDRDPQLPAQFVEPRDAARVGVRRLRIHVDDERDAARQVVDDREFLGQHQEEVRDSGEAGRRGFAPAFEAALDVAHGVVAEHPREPAAEARQARQRRRAKALHEAAHELDRVALVPFDDLSAFDHFDRPAARLDARARGQSDERIASEPLAADDRFEQVAVARSRELQVQRQRSVEVGERRLDQRNAVQALRGERAELVFGEHRRPRATWASVLLRGVLGSARTPGAVAF